MSSRLTCCYSLDVDYPPKVHVLKAKPLTKVALLGVDSTCRKWSLMESLWVPGHMPTKGITGPQFFLFSGHELNNSDIVIRHTHERSDWNLQNCETNGHYFL
jgi:hypothetical protein